MNLDLHGHRALVTGAGQGLGRAIALTLQKAGANVAGIDIDADALAALDGSGIATQTVDVTNATALADYVTQAGGFDIGYDESPYAPSPLQAGFVARSGDQSKQYRPRIGMPSFR